MRPVKFKVSDNIFIEERGENSWAVVNFCNTLGKDGKWEYEPLPSSRTDEYLNNYRYFSEEEALESYKKLKSRK